jgi:hypothetical protein
MGLGRVPGGGAGGTGVVTSGVALGRHRPGSGRNGRARPSRHPSRGGGKGGAGPPSVHAWAGPEE